MPIACQSGEGLTGVCHVFTLQKYYFFVGERYEYRKTCVASDILSLFLREDVILRSADGHRVKPAFGTRLSNWQLFEGGRGTTTLRRPRRGDVCAVLRLCFAVRWGVSSSEGTRCERRRGKREAFHSKKSPLQGRGCAAKGIYSKCAARWATVIRLDVAGGRDR